MVPQADITPLAVEGGAVSVMQPTSPADITLPEYGVRLEIPAPVQQETLQVRLSVLDPASLPGQRNTEVLRAVQIDLFDGQGNPRDDAPFWFKAKLSLTLTADEIEQIGGLGTVLGQFSEGRLALRRLSSDRRGWADLHTLFDINTRTFSVRTAQFSTIALTRSRLEPLRADASPAGRSPHRWALAVGPAAAGAGGHWGRARTRRGSAAIIAMARHAIRRVGTSVGDGDGQR